MGVFYESQVYASCDNCGDSDMSSVMKLADFKKYLRKNGWQIGMLTLCPVCAKAIKGQKPR